MGEVLSPRLLQLLKDTSAPFSWPVGALVARSLGTSRTQVDGWQPVNSLAWLAILAGPCWWHTTFPRSKEAESAATEALFHPCGGLGAGVGQPASLQLLTLWFGISI